MNDKRPVILAVDDTPENLDVLVGILKDKYRVKVAPNGTRALELAGGPERPDLILLDIMMPGMDGFDVCGRLKSDATVRDIPVIFISSLSQTTDKVKAFTAGGVDYVTKPFEPEEVTARIATHLELRRQKRELEQSYARLQALEQLRDNLTHMIIHDMRSPLMAITGGLGIISEDATFEDTENADILNMAAASGQDLTEMVNSLLDISRMESGNMPLEREDHDLKGIAEAAVNAMAANARFEGVDITVSGDSATVHVDETIVRRVFANLIGNAIKFTPGGGTVELKVKRSAETVRAEVIDAGPGIPEDYHEKVFEKFGQVEARRDKQKHSSGLGLTFCKLAVEAHGGHIGVDSEPGKGSTFWFELPVNS